MVSDTRNQIERFFMEKVKNKPECRNDLQMFNYTIQFHIIDEKPFILEARNGQIIFRDDKATRPDLVIETKAETFRRILNREISPTEAWNKGEIKVRGLSVGHFSEPTVFPWLLRLIRYGLGRELPPK